MTINWTDIGKEHSETDGAKEKIIAAYNKMKWLDLKDKPTMGFMQGMGIKSAIKEFHIPAVAVAETSALAPFGLYGIRAIYQGSKNVDVLIVDEGTGIVPVCTIEIN